MYCPQCRGEFREGFMECSDCHVPLLTGPTPDLLPDPSPNSTQDLELVTVLVASNLTELALAQGILEDSGIPYLLNGRKWGPVSKYRTSMAFMGDAPLTIQVASDRAPEARALVAPLAQK
jgi:hypothetical protein